MALLAGLVRVDAEYVYAFRQQDGKARKRQINERIEGLQQL